MEYFKIVKHSLTPRPEPGWMITNNNKDNWIGIGNYLIDRCSCSTKYPPLHGLYPSWPDRDPTNPTKNCGAHLKKYENGRYKDISILAYRDATGWTIAAEGATIQPYDISGNVISLYQNKEYLYQGKEPVKASKVMSTNLKPCPYCGSPGEDLVFNFYCSNKQCRNYHL